MSQSYAVVIIFQAGQWTLGQALGRLAPVLQPGVAEPSWAEQRLDERCVLVADASKVVPGAWRWLQAAARDYEAAVWTPSATSIHQGADEGMKVVDHYLASALVGLRPTFEYFSILPEHAERDWVEKVFAHLRVGDWDSLLKPAYERMLLPPHLADRFIDHPHWRVLEDEEAGLLVQTREL